MYNGIGLQTPRGSGTNGHVQRNWALVRPHNKDKLSYRTEEELAKLDAATNRQPNKEILDHERKRKIELKCVELEEILEEKGYNKEAIETKVENYRKMLMGHDGKLDMPKDEWGRIAVTETHQVAEAQQEKNAKLREAFGISEYFVDGSSFDPAREAKEQVAKANALREQEKLKDQEQAKRYELVHTPSPEPQPATEMKKKKKRKAKDDSSSEEPKKKKKGKKHKKERSGKSKDKKKNKRRRRKSSTDSNDSTSSSDDSSDSSSEEEKRKKRKAKKKEKKRIAKKKRRTSSESSRASSPEPPAKKSKSDLKSEKSKDYPDDDGVKQTTKAKEKRIFDERKQYDLERSTKLRHNSPSPSKIRRSRSHTKDNNKSSKPTKKYSRYSTSPKYNRRYSRSPRPANISKYRHGSRSRSRSDSRRRHPVQRTRSPNRPDYKYGKSNYRRNYSPSPKRNAKRLSVSPQNKHPDTRMSPNRKSHRSKSPVSPKLKSTFMNKSPSPRNRSQTPNQKISSSKRRSVSPNHRSSSPNKYKHTAVKSKMRSPSPKHRTPTPKKKLATSTRQQSPVNRKISKSPKTSSNSQRKSASPRKRSTSPRKRSPSPRKRSPSPRRKYSSPRRRSPSPRRRSPSPRRRSPSLRRRSPSPRRRSPSPRKRSPSLKRRSPLLKRHSISPRRRSQSPNPRYPLKYQQNSSKNANKYLRDRLGDSSRERKYSTSPAPKNQVHSPEFTSAKNTKKSEESRTPDRNSEQQRDKCSKNRNDGTSRDGSHNKSETADKRISRSPPISGDHKSEPKSKKQRRNNRSSSSSSRHSSRDRSRDKCTVKRTNDNDYKNTKPTVEYKKPSPGCKNKHVIPMPVVRLRSSSEESEFDNDNDNIDEEREKELRTLKILKSDLAAKAKEVLEKKIPKKSPTHTVYKSPDNNKYNHFDIPSVKSNHSPTAVHKVERLVTKTEINPIKLIPLKKPIHSQSPENKPEKKDLKPETSIEHNEFDMKSKEIVGQDDVKSNEKNVVNWEKTEVKRESRSVVKAENIKRRSTPSSSRSRSRSDSREKSVSKDRKSQSSSRSSYSSGRQSRSSSSTSSRSRSRSRSVSRSRSHSRSRSRSRSHSSSSSSSSSRSNSRSRSPSIPRRHGSPSFLDRRRITSARKRPIPYHRPTPSSPSSISSSSSRNSSPWYSRFSPNKDRSESDSPTGRSHSSRSHSRTPTYNR